MNIRVPAAAILLVLYPAWSDATASENGDTLDFTDKITPVCEIAGLNARPPAGWFNVPIESGDEAVRGCQMMRAREGDEALVGIARVLSVQFPNASKDPPWWATLITLETSNIERMGISLGKVLWSREDVPIQGQGFSNARAIGLESRIEGNDTPQEAHFLVFEKGPTKYIVTLLTPAKEVEDGVYYKRNASDFGVLIRSFTLPGR